MRELVEVIVKALVDDPESVVVTEKEEGRTTVVEVQVADSDMGKVIGKQGRIAQGHPRCRESSSLKRRQESGSRYRWLRKRAGPGRDKETVCRDLPGHAFLYKENRDGKTTAGRRSLPPPTASAAR